MQAENLLNKAVSIAKFAHQGQVDKAGVDYINHPIRVMNAVDDVKEKIVAVLHDVVEDSDITLEDLRKQGFEDDVVIAVGCLTKVPGETYEQFIGRVKSNSLARNVKLQDLKDNMDLSRLDKVSEKDLNRVEKYKHAVTILLNTEVS
ncbi:Guanosine-3',5'-bis(Diphosphate) 3'-pyrophosphohydrolase [hydrothermal vent metagenome]|uniref:Guanosine-3',5'-bis(Diphosphate) 3'-pyrophosphohydrolase n=1 Tax=hydrothermal vent metagenome TaxID=652676 RepID=A0A3B1A8B6_9ZZZZ